MYYSTLAARSLIRISRSISQGYLILGALIGFQLVAAPSLVIASIFITALFIISKQRSARLVFKQFNQHICRIYVLTLFHHLVLSWIIWGALYFLKELFFSDNIVFPHQLLTLLEVLLILCFFTLLTLTLLKTFLCFLDRKKHNASVTK